MKHTLQILVGAAFGLALGMMTTGTSQAITIDTVTIGDIGNTADTTGYGAVAYLYNIGTTEVNLTQYTAFLNAVAATDTYGLYNTSMETNGNIAGISRSGSIGSYTYSVIGSGNRPVTFVSWFDAARFSNWMANGQPIGAQVNATTERGAYNLNGATTGVGFTKQATNENTGQAVNWWIPSENEWYKAAYYKGGGINSGYWLYPTASDTIDGNIIGAGENQANFYNGVYSATQSATYSASQNYLTDGGAFSNSASFYGTYDQGGNVTEWNDSVISDFWRGLRGGSWYGSGIPRMQSADRESGDPSYGSIFIGFRVASVPEPSTGVLMLLGGAAYWLVRRKKATL